MAIKLTDIKDVMIFESGNGGDFQIKNNDLSIIDGITNQVYLALFGGNIEEVTTPGITEQGARFDYWGNDLFGFDYNSFFEKAILSTALNSEGVLLLESAAKKDLKSLEEFADIEVEGSITGIGKFQLSVELTEPDNKSTKIKYIWDTQNNELIEQKTI